MGNPRPFYLLGFVGIMLISIRIGVHFLPVDHPPLVSNEFSNFAIVDYAPDSPNDISKNTSPLGPLSKLEIDALNREAGLPLKFEAYGGKAERTSTTFGFEANQFRVDIQPGTDGLKASDLATLQALFERMWNHDCLTVALDAPGLQFSPTGFDVPPLGQADWVLWTDKEGTYTAVIAAKNACSLPVEFHVDPRKSQTMIDVSSPWIAKDHVKTWLLDFLGGALSLQAIVIWFRVNLFNPRNPARLKLD